MNLDSKIKIDFQKIELMMSSNDMFAAFCKTASSLFEEFEKEYIHALINSNSEKLDDITHKVLSTARMMGLEDFYNTTKKYKELDLSDENSKAPLISQISDNVADIKNGLLQKAESLTD